MLLCAPNWLFLLPGAFLFALGLGLVFWLFPGPRQVGKVIFDIHTMLFGMMFALVGAQIIAIGLFAKVFSYAERVSNNHHSLERWLRRVKLEHGLGLGGILNVGGGAGACLVFWEGVGSEARSL